jgi:hypothetical protein
LNTLKFITGGEKKYFQPLNLIKVGMAKAMGNYNPMEFIYGFLRVMTGQAILYLKKVV